MLSLLQHDGYVLSTKLRPPTLPPDFVLRPRVHERLAMGEGRRLTLACAPAGFGKTTALAGWLQEIQKPWAWVNLDEHDSDLASFTSVLVSAIRTLAPSAGRQTLALLSQTEHPVLSQLSSLLAGDLATIEEPHILVLDDYHLIREPAIHVLVSLLLHRLPSTVQLVIASREDPPLPSAVLRGRRELAEVRAEDLRFDLSEASMFLQSASCSPLQPRTVASALQWSEGWGVGLRLMTLDGAPAFRAESGPDMLPGRGRQFADAFLLEEVLTRQTAELQRFLMQTSVLERFCSSLCEAVIDGFQPGDAQRLLDVSLAAGLFLISLDDHQRWYRYHHLFRDMLRRRLEREGGEQRVRALRLRASIWLAEQGLLDEAASQALEAGDVARVAALVEERHADSYSLTAKLALDVWIRRLPSDLVSASPTLSLLRCSMLGLRGEVGALDAELRRVEATLIKDPSLLSPSALALARGHIDAQLGVVLHQVGGNDQEAHDRLTRALQTLPRESHDLRGGAAGTLAITLHCLGRTEEALTRLGAELSKGAALHPTNTGRLLSGQAYVEVSSGRLNAAVHTARQMVTFGDAHDNTLVVGWGRYVLGRVAYEWNDLPGAREHFEAGLALGQSAHRICSVNTTLGLALILVALGHQAEAEQLLLRELELFEESRNTFFIEGLRSFMARLALSSTNPDQAKDWLAGVSQSRHTITAYDVEDPLITRALVLFSDPTSDRLAEAATVLDRALAAAESRHIVSSIVKALALRALVERSRGEVSNAFRSIIQALEAGAPGRFTRTFVDLGPPMTGLLVELASHGRLPKAAERVLEACRAASGVLTSSLPDRRLADPDGVVALTWRELDVLHLMDSRHTNKEIARLLSIAEETAKKHAANIYGKLQVAGRRDAVARAYALGLLRQEDRRPPRLA